MKAQIFSPHFAQDPQAVASLGETWGRTAPGDTLQGGDTGRKKFCGQIYKE